MSAQELSMFWYVLTATVMLVVTGLYCIIVTSNLIRALVGAEIMIKGITLLIIYVGKITGKIALCQELVITLIVIEVVVMVVAGGIILSIFRNSGHIDAKKLNELKG